MWRRALAVVAVGLLFTPQLAAVADRPDKKKKADPVQEELKRLEGTWTFQKGSNRITIRGGTYTATDPKGKVVLAAVMTIDPSKRPKWLTMRYTAGSFKGKTLFGVYELNGDTLRVYIPVSGPRPTEHPFRGGSTLHRLKR
jgi:uncharacterized protein (TIGR03067 family)